MTHFSRPDVLKQLIDEMEVEITAQPISIQIPFPLGNILDTIYLEIIEKIGVNRIIQALKSLEETNTIRPQEQFEEKVSEYLDPQIAKAFVVLSGKKEFVFQRYLSHGMF